MAWAVSRWRTKGFRAWVYLLPVPVVLVVVYLAQGADRLTADDMPAVAEFVDKVWNQEPFAGGGLPDRFSDTSSGVYVAVRRRGERRYHTWRFDGTVRDSLEAALGSARDNRNDRGGVIDSVEIVIPHSFREVSWRDDRREIVANIHRGVRGIEMRFGEKRKIYSPTYLLASNRKTGKQIATAAEEWGLTGEGLEEIQFRTFEAEQILVDLDAGPPTATLMERGNVYVPAEDVTRENTKRLIDLQSKWLVNNVHADGRMTYLYWPSTGTEAPSSRNNMIRQWMATVALGRIAARDDPATWDIVERNIDYNLSRFYRLEGGLGMIEWNGKVKLGALALAAYAIVNHPKRAQWRAEEAAIRRTIDELWRPDGRFESFFKKPPNTREQQNFYPGEALLLWADLYEKERDEKLLDRFMKSFEYYREWHLEPLHRDPSFIPWHTQAYYQVWKITRDERLADFIFEMNDWLVPIQQWDDVRYRDAQGRFYATGSRYGPPHASSTGVYMEGLVDAWELARELGDGARAETYRVALARGLRSVMQLQFVDDIDMFYVSKRGPVLGGLRTTVYDNAIRCDNVQHSLMANLKIFERFAPEDYEVAAAAKE